MPQGPLAQIWRASLSLIIRVSEKLPILELMMLRDLKCQDPSALHQLSITALQKSYTFALATSHAKITGFFSSSMKFCYLCTKYEFKSILLKSLMAYA